jgi:hypothetical protein
MAKRFLHNYSSPEIVSELLKLNFTAMIEDGGQP